MKNPPCSPAAIGEICYEFKDNERSKKAFLKVKDVDERINLLIDYEFWEDAVKESFKHKKFDEFQ